MKRFPLHPLFCIWIPLAFLVFQFWLEHSFSSSVLAALHSEWGPHETIQFFLILAAFVVAAFSVFPVFKTNRALALWFALAALCSLYVAGEEVSWGQHLFNWPTPEEWARLNDQNETNLHNTSSWLDQKPRLILEIGIIVGGLIVPFLLRFYSRLLPLRFAILYPPQELVFIAFLVIGPKIADSLAEGFGFSLFERVSEVQEVYMYAFILLYLLDLREKSVLKQNLK